MNAEILQQFESRPSALGFMTRAFLPSSGLRFDRPLPSIVARWSGLRIDPRHVAAFHETTGLNGQSVLYPHVFGFRLQMTVLTHRAYPLPIWGALQIRNHLIRHRAIDFSATYDLETRIGECRAVAKGVEIDLVTHLSRGGQCDWESIITYYYRGCFGGSQAESPIPASPDLSGAPQVAAFKIPSQGGWAFGTLTGDYNGIHTWTFYAQRFGFKAAFLHPQRAAGMAMARLKEPLSEAQSLDLWNKGPVFYGSQVSVSAIQDHGEARFGISLSGDDRAAIVGVWKGN